jgi:peptidoglycan endopeptidase LytE
MQYRAVSNRCAVHLPLLNLPISDTKALEILESKGFKVLEVDLIVLARQCIKMSTYHRGAKPLEAPTVVDCSSFIKWLYGQRGIWLPRRSIQQRELGIPVTINEINAGDVIFVSGWIDYYHTDPKDGVGHVGIATGEGTVIHAANKKDHVIETSLESFVDKNKFRGVRRYVPKNQTALTLEIPPNRDVEIADDLRWIVLQSLPKQ